MNGRHRLGLWISVSAGVGWLAALAPLAWAWQRLPDPVATHFGLQGQANGHLSRGGLVATLCALVMGSVLLAWPYARTRSGARGEAGTERERRAAAPLRLGIVALASSTAVLVSGLTVALNLDRAGWTAAGPLRPGMLLGLLGVPPVVGLVLAAVARRIWPSDGSSEAPSEALPLAEGERAYWSGSASNRWTPIIMLAIVVESVVLLLAFNHHSRIGTPVLLVQVLVVIVLEQLWLIRVSVNARGLSIAYGHTGWIRQHIAMDRISSASALDLEPLAHGGWGYRGSLKLRGRAAVVVRSGSALRLALRDGAELFITVDDAETAARLINGFVERRAERPPIPTNALASVRGTR